MVLNALGAFSRVLPHETKKQVRLDLDVRRISCTLVQCGACRGAGACGIVRSKWDHTLISRCSSVTDELVAEGDIPEADVIGCS
jgi:hypothetical protein